MFSGTSLTIPRYSTLELAGSHKYCIILTVRPDMFMANSTTFKIRLIPPRIDKFQNGEDNITITMHHSKFICLTLVAILLLKCIDNLLYLFC